MRRISWFFGGVSIASMLGCSSGDAAVSHNEPAVGQTSSALSTIYRTTVSSPAAIRGGPSYPPCMDYDLGPISDRTCFLTGIYGDFRGETAAGGFGGEAEIHALPVEGDDYIESEKTFVYNRWIGRLCPGMASIWTAPGVGAGITATFACVPSTSENRVRFGVGGDAVATAQAIPNRQCMLSGIGTTVDDFSRPPFNASIALTDGTWQLTAGGVPGTGTDYAWAVCFDTTATATSFAEYRDPYSANISSGSVDEVACGLTALRLGLYTWEYPSLGNGVDVQNIAGSGWWMDNTTTNGVTATCLE